MAARCGPARTERRVDPSPSTEPLTSQLLEPIVRARRPRTRRLEWCLLAVLLLAAVVALALRGELALAFQLLIYPATEQHRTHDSHRRNAQGYLLTADTMTWFHDHYITEAALDSDWRASPLRHPDLAGLPPALVLTAGYDPLRDEGVAYAQRLSEAGVRATLLSFERQIHGFILMGRVIDEANEAVALCADALRRALQP